MIQPRKVFVLVGVVMIAGLQMTSTAMAYEEGMAGTAVVEGTITLISGTPYLIQCSALTSRARVFWGDCINA